jgi:hypothetical protein
MKISTNLYPTKKTGFYIYKRKDRNERYLAHRKFPCGYVKSALLYSLDDAIAWLDAL